MKGWYAKNQPKIRTIRKHEYVARKTSDPEKVKANAKAARIRRLEKDRVRRRAYYAENRLRVIWKNNRAEAARRGFEPFAATLEEFVAWYEAQPKRCACCGSTEELGVDHDHSTGALRALLCRVCNLVEGMVRGVAHLQQLVVYIKMRDAVV